MEKLNIAFITPEKAVLDKVAYLWPLGPLKLEAYCRDIANFDFYFGTLDEKYNEDKRKYDVIAISIANGGYDKIDRQVISNIQKLKKYNIPILLGGNFPRYYPDIENYVDWVCYYEGEKPLRRALLNIINNEPLVHSKTYELLTPDELDNIPPIDPSCCTNGIMPIQLGIGCPNNCIFCDSWGSQGKQLRHPSLEKILSDIDYYADKGMKVFQIIDDTLFSDREYYIKILEHIKRKGLRIIAMYISPYFDNEELALIADLTYPVASLNIDACNEKMFYLARKNGSFQRIPYIVDYLKSRGFYVQAQIIVNFPFETEADRQEGIRFFSSLNIDSLQAVPLVPMQGTPVRKLIYEDDTSYILRGLAMAEKMNNIVNNNLQNKKRVI